MEWCADARIVVESPVDRFPHVSHVEVLSEFEHTLREMGMFEDADGQAIRWH